MGKVPVCMCQFTGISLNSYHDLELEVPEDGLTLDLKFMSISQAWVRNLEDDDSISFARWRCCRLISARN